MPRKTDKITAPSQNENQEYTPLVGVEEKVFVQDLGISIPISQCTKFGSNYWSKQFLWKFQRNIELLNLEIEHITSEWEYFNQQNGNFHDKKIPDRFKMIEQVLLPLIKKQFEKLGVDFSEGVDNG